MTDHLTDTNVGNIEYIRKADAIDILDDFQAEIENGEGNYSWAKFKMNELEPADVAPVVRCKDCIYQKPDTVYGGNWCWVHREPFMLKTLDGFCSYGERREE